MVAPAVAFLLAMCAGTTMVAVDFAKPRLPAYKLQLLQTFPSWEEWFRKARVKASISMHNENYVNIDVHAMTFDMFYMKSTGDDSLTHIGQVHDRLQQEQQRLHRRQRKQAAASNSSSCSCCSHQSREFVTASASEVALPEELDDERAEKKIFQDPLWHIPPRADFRITDTMYMTTNWLQPSLVWRLVSSWWEGRGSFFMPMTGVVHIKASAAAAAPKAPFTVSIVCDNRVDTWTMEVISADCTQYRILPGWSDLQATAESVRNHVVTNLRANATGSVLI